ncbi:hypothetical protein GCM10025781_11110 [Kocuria gwangalliensis]|uniref:LemA family protein n=1 Tax=Kocuria gwangalliensis TaxID=501592 RepID=A0ABP8WVJ3_9MICC
MATIIASIAGIILTALLGYLAGLHRDGRSVELERERERRHDVQAAAIEIIEACRDKFAAHVSNRDLGRFFDSKEYDTRELEPSARPAELRIISEARSKSQIKDAEQIAAAQQRVNRAIIQLRIQAPELVEQAEKLRQFADRVPRELPKNKSFDYFDNNSETFAQAVREHLSSPQRTRGGRK